MEYERLSDFEVNRLVADKLGVYWHSRPEQNKTMSWIYSDNYCYCNTKFDAVVDLPGYCNSAADAWPIIVGNRISLSEDEGVWDACVDGKCEYISDKRVVFNLIVHSDKNPLRAAMIVFLMMNEGGE